MRTFFEVALLLNFKIVFQAQNERNHDQIKLDIESERVTARNRNVIDMCSQCTKYSIHSMILGSVNRSVDVCDDSLLN